MGACATKPKADATDAPAPLPEKDEVVKNELTVAATVVETKEVVDAVDKLHSLSNLLNESEQVKGSTENEKTRPELVKEEACEAEKDTDISETKTTEVAKSEILVETTPTPTADVAGEVNAEKAVEVEAATEKTEILVEKAIPVEKAVEVEAATEKTEILVEKAIPVVDVPSKVETEELAPIICADTENEAGKEPEVASATEVQKTEAVEDTKIEEHDKAIETPVSESIEVESAGEKTEVVEEKASAPVEVEADKKTEAASAIEIQKTEALEETKIEEEKAVTEEKTTESEACAENVKP